MFIFVGQKVRYSELFIRMSAFFILVKLFVRNSGTMMKEINEEMQQWQPVLAENFAICVNSVD